MSALRLETVKALALPDLRTKLAEFGGEAIDRSPEEFAAVTSPRFPKRAIRVSIC